MDDRHHTGHDSRNDNGGNILRNAMISGSAASAASALALAVCSGKDARTPFSAVNAVSHWVWGDRAFRRDQPSWRYTALGMAIHHASAVFWGTLFERVFGRRLDHAGPAATLAAAAATTAAACFTDYQLTPRRLQPGFEQRLSTPSLAAVYVAFGLGLAAGALAIHRHR
jgi:hypothetical protein